MALDLYRISLGIALEDKDGTERAHILSGTGAPGGDTGPEDDSLVGSIYLRTDATSSISAVWQKITDTNAAADWVQSASKDYVDAAVNGLSWREPVLVKDATAYADVAAAVTAANVGDTVDGETIAALDRILFTNIANLLNIAAQDETNYDGGASNGTFTGGSGHAALDVITTDDGSTITVDAIGSNTIAAQDETDFDNIGSNGTFAAGTGHVISDVITLTDGSTITVDNTDVSTIAAQDETNFDGIGSNGTFAGGTGHNNGDVITMSDGSTITVDLEAGNIVTEFTVTTDSTSNFASGGPITQTGTTGAGINFAITTGLNNEQDGEVTEFTVTTASTSNFTTGATLTQSSSTGSGTSYTLTTDTNNELAGIVDQFTVTTASTTPFVTGATQSQSGTTGAGTGYSFTTDTNNEIASSPDLNNIYIVSGSTGAWTFTSDPDNAATDGDAVLVQSGTCADEQWVYDGTNWVQFGGASSNLELGYIRAFIGKTAAGSELPTYSSTNVVTASANLEVAIGEIDTALGDRVYTEDNYVTDGETFTASIDALDQAIAANSLSRNSETTVTAQTTVDTVLVDDYQAAKWFIAVYDEGDLDQKFAAEIYAIHDGTTGADATQVDWNEVSRLRINGQIIGLQIDVVLAGTGAAQTMGIAVTSTDTVTVHTTRVDVEI